MILSPRLRKFALTAHVATSVGWLGAVVAFFALSVAGMRSNDADIVRSAYVGMNLLGAFIIVPLSLAALGSGLVQAVGTQWGLIRHYWVLTKFALTVVATTLLLMHQLTAVAAAARRALAVAPGGMPNVGSLGMQLLVDAAAASVLLLVTTTLSVYKPWGRTRHGRRVEDEEAPSATPTGAGRSLPAGLRIFLAVVAAIIGVILVVHLAGGGLSHH